MTDANPEQSVPSATVPEPRTPDPGPRADYRVQLDAYAGPLDLLLYLVKRHEIDLQDIPVAELTEQYLDHLKVIQTIDVDRAGEFLVMAATLVEIKSALLMPRLEAEQAEDGDDPTDDATADPRFELVQQLLAYKRFKDASLALDERRNEWDVRFPALAKTPKPPAPGSQGSDPDADDDASGDQIELDLEDANVMDLCSAFGRMLDAIGFTGDHEVTYDDTPISLHADDIADRLERDGGPDGMTLQQIFVGRASRSEMIGLFLATLELVRQRRVQVIQAPRGGEIRLQLRPESDRNDLDDRADQEDRDWKNPDTGEIEYDWPDEATRLRAEKRAKIRATYAAKGQSPPDDADVEGDGPDTPDTSDPELGPGSTGPEPEPRADG